MIRTEDPTPRPDAKPPEPFGWPIVSRETCPPIVPPGTQPFQVVLEARRSHRVFGLAKLEHIVNVIAYGTSPRFWKNDDLFGRTRRPALSAGALHPIWVVIGPSRHDNAVFRYNPEDHSLDRLLFEPNTATSWINRCAELLPDADGTSVVFLAEFPRCDAAYSNAISLLWRDAGALLQTISMISTAYGLAFCPLGLLGCEFVDALHANNHLVSVGAAIIGEASK
ncbi:MAG: hypothetical protein JWO48_927 [Bryobacterales bacterium]|nr:hypothetical protein [Bryobacterales bacterium]